MIWRTDYPNPLPGSYYKGGRLSEEGIIQAFATLIARIDELERKLAEKKKR